MKPNPNEDQPVLGACSPTNKAGGKRPGAGRKPVQIDLANLEKLCVLQCTDEEIGAFVGVSARTIQERRKDPQFAEAMRAGRAKGKISVRRAQMRLLEAGNATMAVWLGKQLLGQREVTPVELTGVNGQPVQIALEVLDGILDQAQKGKKSRRNG
jgi:hypothetical protein